MALEKQMLADAAQQKLEEERAALEAQQEEIMKKLEAEKIDHSEENIAVEIDDKKSLDKVSRFSD